MKSQFLRNVSANLLCFFVLAGLSGCALFDVNKMTEKMILENQKRQNEKWRQFVEAQNQRPVQQSEQDKSKASQMTKVSEPKQEEPPAVKAEEPPKTGSVAQVTDIKQEISGEKSEAGNPATQDAYGSNDAATPLWFVNLPPAEKAALHWVAAQEYWNLHNTHNYAVGVLAEIHETATENILHILYYDKNPPDKITEILNALPFRPNGYEKWRAKTIEKHHTAEGLRNAVAALDHRQREEQRNSSLNRRGCEWMTGKYYINSNPTSLCTPVIGKCVEGNCYNGHGTYISFDGSKFVGVFKYGSAIIKDSIYGYGRCLKGNCDNGHGTYVFRDGTKYEGDFKNAKPDGQGTKTWAIGFSYTGEFTDGMDTGQGKYIWPDKRHLSQETCLEGDCKNGQGVLMYENDTKYVGHFKNGEPHGQGIYYWRTGEALDGEFAYGWLQPGGNHISPDGSVLVQKQKRGWLKTYAEEEADAKRKETAIDLNNLPPHIRKFFLMETLKLIQCQGTYHREGSSAWWYCGH